MENNAAAGKFVLKDIAYDITGTAMFAENADMEIILFPKVEAETKDENVEYEMSSICLYHNNGFNTHVSAFEELKGKRFVWDSEYNQDDEEAGFLCVQEHENVTKGTIEILDVKENLMTIRWSGLANVFWDDKYGENVPFESIFSVSLPETKTYKIDAYKSAGIKIDSDTQLEILDLDEFNEELVRLSNSRQWDQFNAVLKFKLTYSGIYYFGEVIFTNGKNNHITNFDERCPRKVCFINFDFNLQVNYEVFLFEIG